MKSRKLSKLIDFDTSRALIHLLCSLSRIPTPAIRLSEGYGYEGSYNKFEICLRRENSFETVVHEWLHYVFDLIHSERLLSSDRDEDDDYEHRVIMFLEKDLARLAKRVILNAGRKMKVNGI